MKKTTLEDGTKIYCITRLEAQMLDMHVSAYLKNDIVINSKDTIIDVGANIGIFGHRILQQYKPEIIAFEPIDIIYKVLERNAKLSKNDKVDRVVLCSGKIFYDLIKTREEKGLSNIRLIRIEQLYPFPEDAVINPLFNSLLQE